MHPLIEPIVDKVRQHPKLVIVEDFELAIQCAVSQSSRFQNGEEVRRTEDEKIWVSLRLLHRRQPGKAVTTFASFDAIQNLVESAFHSSQQSSPDPWFRFPLWKRPREEKLAPYFAADYDSLYPRLEQKPEIFEETYEEADIVTHLFRKTERFQLTHRRQVHAAHFSLLNRWDDRFFWLREERSQSLPFKDREEWLDSLLRQSDGLKNGRRFEPQGENRVLMGPAVMTQLLKRVSGSFHADLVQEGRSRVPAVKGSTVFSPVLTLVDDAGVPGGAHSAPFDMEGALTQRTVLVDRGRREDLLYDAYSATRDNRISTGNYIRPLGAGAPRIHASNLFVQPSATTLSELFSAMGKGIFLQQVDRIEAVAGTEWEVVLHGAGWAMDSRGTAEPIRDILIQVDLFDLFSRAAAVGDDLAFFGCYGSPSVLFEGVEPRSFASSSCASQGQS